MRYWLAAIVAVAALAARPPAVEYSVPEAQRRPSWLSTGSGLNTGALTGLGNGPVMNGSAIMQMITVPAGGGTLTFDADFLTNAPPPGANLLSAIDPFAFSTKLVLLTWPTISPTIPRPLTTHPRRPARPLAPSQTGYAYQSGYTSFSAMLAAWATRSVSGSRPRDDASVAARPC